MEKKEKNPIPSIDNEIQDPSMNIPTKYQGLPSSLTEELWVNPIYIDHEKNTTAHKERDQALEALRAKEYHREETKKRHLTDLYRALTLNQRKNFPNMQRAAQKTLGEYIQGNKAINGLSREEIFLLEELKSSYESFKKNNPNQPFKATFSQDIDKEIYDNLIQRIAFSHLEKEELADDKKIVESTKQALGVATLADDEDLPQISNNDMAIAELREISKKKSHKPIRKLLKEIETSNDREKITKTLIDYKYNQKRLSDYPFDPNYEKTWNMATKDTTVPFKKENDWLYRGNFPTTRNPTETRGSLNINISEVAIKELDALIKSDIINANYKFGAPNTPASGLDRHDAISIYFLSTPTPEGLQALSAIAKKYYRGNNLLGKKIADGFYLSEIGSVSDKHASVLIQKLKRIDPQIASAVKNTLTSKNWKTQKERTAMSEAQYYTIKEVLNLFDLNIAYNPNKGFIITDTKK